MRKLALPAIVLLIFASATLVSGLRLSQGEAHNIEGVIESVGTIQGSGVSLHGSAHTVAAVHLQSGNLVQVTIPSPDVRVGTRVVLREQPQTFGAPKYSLVQALPDGAP